MVNLYEGDNLKITYDFIRERKSFDLIYADMIYEDIEYGDWTNNAVRLLKPEGILIVQTDYHTVAEVKTYLDLIGMNLVNWCIYLNDWGGTPKKGFPRKHDDILIYSKGKEWKWYGDRIQIPKATAGTKFDKKGTGLKTPPDVFYDHASFSTMSKERVKVDEHNIQWQKPLWLMERLVLPFTDEGDSVLDLFMGSGTLGVWCKHNNRNYYGIELDSKVFNIAFNRIENGQYLFSSE